MRPLIAMLFSLILLTGLLRNRVKIGRSLFWSAVLLCALLNVTPVDIWQGLLAELKTQSFIDTTVYLFLSLTFLLIFVNIIGEIMVITGISSRLVPAVHGLFRSRRAAIAAIPLMMGMLPTPGGIMLSAPMVKDLGKSMDIKISRLATINFFFRHQLEPVWPIFPAVPLAQGILGIGVASLILHNLVFVLASTMSGIVFLLLIGIPKSKNKIEHKHILVNLKDFGHAIWPIVLSIILYAGFNIPPAVGILVGIFGLLFIHHVPMRRWTVIFKAGREFDLVILIAAAMLFKLGLNLSGAVGEIIGFFSQMNIHPYFIIFFLPFVPLLFYYYPMHWENADYR